MTSWLRLIIKLVLGFDPVGLESRDILDASNPSTLGILLYNDWTSMQTSKQSEGKCFWFISSNLIWLE